MPDDPKNSNDDSSKDEGYVLERQKGKPRSRLSIDPPQADTTAQSADIESSLRGKKIEPQANPAAELIRKKIESLYEDEPSAAEEIKEVDQAVGHRSKHQQFMHGLSVSGKPLAQIQQEWHSYYERLSNEEKHEVWREFYEAHERQPSAYTQATHGQENAASARQTDQEEDKPEAEEAEAPVQPKPLVSASQFFPEHLKGQLKKPRQKFSSKHNKPSSSFKNKLKDTVRHRSQAQTKAKQHFKSLLFGLSLGALAILILMFSFFNEVVIARLIQPGGQAETPIILNTDAVAPSDEPQLIIPKINVQLPVVYDVPSNQEEVIQNSLDNGIIQYPGTSVPGQKGNAAYFGHSSNNIFNPGKYKFAFALLKDLVPGDIFYITYNEKVYTYNVYDKRIVKPDETWVLGNAPGKIATAALITCDPPGTTLNRLVVWGEQVSPDPTGNTNAPEPASNQAQELPAQGPTLWGRFWNWITGG